MHKDIKVTTQLEGEIDVYQMYGHPFAFWLIKKICKLCGASYNIEVLN